MKSGLGESYHNRNSTLLQMRTRYCHVQLLRRFLFKCHESWNVERFQTAWRHCNRFFSVRNQISLLFVGYVFVTAYYKAIKNSAVKCQSKLWQGRGDSRSCHRAGHFNRLWQAGMSPVSVAPFVLAAINRSPRPTFFFLSFSFPYTCVGGQTAKHEEYGTWSSLLRTH